MTLPEEARQKIRAARAELDKASDHLTRVCGPLPPVAADSRTVCRHLTQVADRLALRDEQARLLDAAQRLGLRLQ